MILINLVLINLMMDIRNILMAMMTKFNMTMMMMMKAEPVVGVVVGIVGQRPEDKVGAEKFSI